MMMMMMMMVSVAWNVIFAYKLLTVRYAYVIQVAIVFLDRMHSEGKYKRYLPSSLASCLMHYLRLKESDVFFNRVRVYEREASSAVHWFVL